MGPERNAGEKNLRKTAVAPSVEVAMLDAVVYPACPQLRSCTRLATPPQLELKLYCCMKAKVAVPVQRS